MDIKRVEVYSPQVSRHPAYGCNLEATWEPDVKKVIVRARKKFMKKYEAPADSFYVCFIPFEITYKSGSKLIARRRGNGLTRSSSINRAQKNLAKELMQRGLSKSDTMKALRTGSVIPK